MYVLTKSGSNQLRNATGVWKLLVMCEYKSEYWIYLKDMKESHPVQVSEFSKSEGFVDWPAFSWWFLYTLSNIDAILSTVKHHIRNTTHKYGI